MSAILPPAFARPRPSIASRYSPFISWLDKLSGMHDERLTNYGIRISRGLAWYNAVRLADPLGTEDAAAAIVDNPTRMIRGVLHPKAVSVDLLLRFLRWLVSFLRTWPKEDTPRGAAPPAAPG